MADNSLELARTLSTVKVAVDGIREELVQELTVREVNLVESLLTPGLQTSVRLHSHLHNPNKNLDEFKNKIISLEIERPILADFSLTSIMNVKQRIYRLSGRKLLNNNNEEFILQACHDSLLEDAKTLVSSSWSCATPSDIVREVLTQCVGISGAYLDIEESTPPRDYIAKNIRPFRVVAQQMNSALASGEDPSFLHWMTYDEASGEGIHHFRSIQSLVRQGAVIGGSNAYRYSEVGNSYANPLSIMTYNFPCDFDLLSDILNGVDLNGRDINTLITINPLSTLTGMFGNPQRECGLGGANQQVAFTNLGTAENQDSCPMDVEKYMLKRQARMNLLERDKIALKLTVPWNPMLHAGSMIEVKFINKLDGTSALYGSGDYLIVHMVHNIKNGGFSTTTMECVAKTSGVGIV